MCHVIFSKKFELVLKEKEILSNCKDFHWNVLDTQFYFSLQIVP